MDRNWQMAMEFKKVANNHIKHNQERVFGLMSWAHVDDLFNMETIATNPIEGGQTTID